MRAVDNKKTDFIKRRRFSSILLTCTVAGFFRIREPSSLFISTNPPLSATYTRHIYILRNHIHM